MLKQGTFIRRKYYLLLAGGLAGMLASGINQVLDSILSGNLLGETALAAVSIVSPLLAINSFTMDLFSAGYGIRYGVYSGRFDRENAYKTAGQMLLTACMAGMLLMSCLLILKEPFLAFYHCTGELYEHASAYYTWVIVAAGIVPFEACSYYLLIADGDTALLSVSSVANVLVNAGMSTLLCRVCGVAGIGMGTCVGWVVTILIRSFHLRKKNNSIRFRFSFRHGEFVDAVKISCPTACYYFFRALLDLVLNKVILLSCGVTMITAYCAVSFVCCLYEGFTAVTNASSGLLATFFGEKNPTGIKNLFRPVLQSTVGLGLIMTVLLLLCAPLISSIYGLTSPQIAEAATIAVRLLAFSAVPYGITRVMIGVFTSLENVKLSLFLTVLNGLVCPLALAVPLCFLYGFTGLATGLSFSYLLVLILFFLLVRCRRGKEGFPLYLDTGDVDSVSFDLEISPESMVEIRDIVKRELDGRNCSVKQIELLTEELYRRIYEKNPGKTVCSECTLLFTPDTVRVIVRDDGALFNFVNANNPVDSLNTYVLNSLLERVPGKEYLLTISFNRNGFSFPRQPEGSSSHPDPRKDSTGTAIT